MTPRSITAQNQTEGEPPQSTLPIATITVVALTAIVTSLQWVYPALLPLLDRNQAALLTGQWWRLVSPRLVQPEIWPQYILLAILAVVGVPVERRLGSLRWLIVWLVGSTVGEVISYQWQPQGAGASLGLFALIGAWLALLLRRQPAGPWWVAVVAFALLIDLIGAAMGSALVGAIAAALMAALIVQLRQRAAWSQLLPALGVVGLFGGLVLCGMRDQHGPPLLAGAAVAAVLIAVAQR
ncbi:MAG: rhomboid family intramembrane serine protease [Caldilineaceae bacterium]